jgi:hypothetical protein
VADALVRLARRVGFGPATGPLLTDLDPDSA